MCNFAQRGSAQPGSGAIEGESDSPHHIHRTQNSNNKMTNIWQTIITEFQTFSIKEAFSAFALLFVAVDVIGAIPIVLSLKDKGQVFSPIKVSLYSFFMLIVFLFMGVPMLNFFGVDINSFAIAGSIVLFVLAVEMLFGIQVFKDEGPEGNANIVPLVFPLFAGAASFTAMLTMRSSGYTYISIVLAVLGNGIAIYLMLRFVDPLQRWLGRGGIFVLRKFFGVILLALSIKFFIDNLMHVIDFLRTPAA